MVRLMSSRLLYASHRPSISAWVMCAAVDEGLRQHDLSARLALDDDALDAVAVHEHVAGPGVEEKLHVSLGDHVGDDAPRLVREDVRRDAPAAEEEPGRVVVGHGLDASPADAADDLVAVLVVGPTGAGVVGGGVAAAEEAVAFDEGNPCPGASGGDGGAGAVLHESRQPAGVTRAVGFLRFAPASCGTPRRDRQIPRGLVAAAPSHRAGRLGRRDPHRCGSRRPGRPSHLRAGPACAKAS